MDYNKDFKISFYNSFPIFEKTIQIHIEPEEFNLSYNPTLTKDEFGNLHDFVTGSFFSPYFTTIGLYNDNNDLLLVAKMAQPIPITLNNEMDILIKLDM